jgi:hypothetical protein
MSERLDLTAEDPVQALRVYVLTKALGQTSITESFKRGEQCGKADIYPLSGEHPRYTIRVFEEGTEEDGAIAQLSIEDFNISEAHLVLCDDLTTYEEHDVDGQIAIKGEIEDHIALSLLSYLIGTLE